MKNVKCNKCGWVHFEVSAEYVRKWEADWLLFFNTKDAEWLESYGITTSPPSTDIYLKCFRCGGSYKDMRDTLGNEVPNGSTIQPILNRNESV